MIGERVVWELWEKGYYCYKGEKVIRRMREIVVYEDGKLGSLFFVRKVSVLGWKIEY